MFRIFGGFFIDFYLDLVDFSWMWWIFRGLFVYLVDFSSNGRSPETIGESNANLKTLGKSNANGNLLLENLIFLSQRYFADTKRCGDQMQL